MATSTPSTCTFTFTAHDGTELAYHVQGEGEPLLCLPGGEALVLAGDLDSNPSPALAARLAELFARGVADVQPGGGHFPWLDEPRWFADRVERFLATGA